MNGGRRKRQLDDGGASGKIDHNRTIALCGIYAITDDASIPDIFALRDMNGNNITSLPPCPPTTDQIGIVSHIFEAFPTQPDNCFRSNSDNTFLPDPSRGSLHRPFIFVSVCCYDSVNG